LHQGLVTIVAITNDGSVLGTGGQDGAVRFWDISHEDWWNLPPCSLGKNGDSLVGHYGHVSALWLSKSQGVAVSGGQEGSAIIWDLARCTCVQVLEGHKDAIVDVTIDDENGSILTCSASRVQAWSINGQLLASMHRHDSKAFKVDARACASRQGSIWTSETIFITGHSDGHIAFWKLIPMARARREGVIPRDVAEPGQGEQISPRVLAPMWTLAGSGEAVTVLRLNADCREIVSGHERGQCKVWRISENRPMMQEMQVLMEQVSLHVRQTKFSVSVRPPTSLASPHS
jgi:WD40 repeat protein